MFIIRAAKVKDPELCPIEDLRQCLTSVGDIVYYKFGRSKGLSYFNDMIFPYIVSGDSEKMKLATDLCEKASQSDVNGVINVLCFMGGRYCINESRAESSNCDDDDGPTSERGNCFAVSADNYKAYSYDTITLMVDGMDYAGGKLL